MRKSIIIAVVGVTALAGTAALADRDHGWFGFGGGREDHAGGPMGGPMGDMIGALLPDFAALDSDANGQITAEELAAAQAARFAAADGDADGGLSAAEIVAQMEARRAEMMTARAEAMLAEQDANADGLLQADEMPQGPGPRPAVLFAMLDTNGDGSVDQAEFDAGLAALAERGGRHQRG